MDPLLRRAQALLEANTRTGTIDGRTYTFTIPAVGAYPFQWFWDSCFHAIVWSRIDRERAADELRSLLAWQADDGFVPHAIFWDQHAVRLSQVWHYLESRGIPFLRRPHTTMYVQPPVLAQAIERVGGDFAREALPQAARFYRWLARERDPDGDGLVSVISQFESGLDYCPAYCAAAGAASHLPTLLFLAARQGEVVNRLLRFDLDRIFRLTGHHVEGMLFNSVFGDGLRALARLARGAGDEALARWADATASNVTAALLERSWDEQAGLFFNLIGRRERPARALTVASLMPLVLGDLPSDIAARLVERLVDPRAFWTPSPVASVARSEPSFTRDSRVRGVRFIWRGPCSLNTNWLLTLGLRRHGYRCEAEELAARSRELVERGGFNEFYDPLDGDPVGAPNFGWATLAADIADVAKPS